MDEIVERYRAHAGAFERKVAGVVPGRWDASSPCPLWTARDVVGHVVDMHGVMLRPFGRGLSPAPPVKEDPLGAFRAARADVEAVLADPARAAAAVETPGGRMTFAEHVDQVVSDDMVIHGWDLARATGQDETIDPADVERMWADARSIPADLVERLRTPGAFGPGVEILGPEVPLPPDAPLQHRLLAFFGRDPR
ncbi:TIGR03086 family metal-binding protein [Bailinhaonella thermotolerans]|uniref:TIGR03086 family protein n=1 Tax=Bailinhaonella thermotolerans TaxID=1070861 RepID=A0A3A4BEL7_9ACTN|nr:TIGR03086 family metal-binding protein [Bailinhaonella thermotolerans]RJL32760.1 TIGR03086 family protein [Bailinhaonella thermotolerans]